MKSIINDTIKALQALGLFLMWGLFAAGMLAVFWSFTISLVWRA